MSRPCKPAKSKPVSLRAVSYSRYSTDLQDERSIADQEALIRRYAQVNGLDLVGCYSDAAQSGASILGRDGLLQLLADVKLGKIDVVVVEELDRLSRDMEDLAGIHKRLSFAGVEIRAVHEGVASTVTVGLRGLFGQMFREDNARKIRRGLSGRVMAGKSPGGKAFGYRPHPTEKGRLVIVEEEAAIIRQIFLRFAGGESPVQIARALTEAGAPKPRAARAWQSSTIYGWEERRSGILRNDLYVGRLVWNKMRMMKDPETGRRVSKPNPESEWQVRDVPELRIIDQALWDAVQEKVKPREDLSPADRARMKRPVRPLSGMLRCAACASGMSVKGKDKSGRARIGCTRHMQSRTCPAPRTWYLDLVEEHVIGLLRAELDKPELLELYIAEYNRARTEFAGAQMKRRNGLQRVINDLEAETGRLISFVARGIGDVDRLASEYEEKCRRLAEARAEIQLEPEPIKAVALHPMAVAGYRKDLANIAPLMAQDHAGGASGYASALRQLIDTVTIGETSAGQMEISITGRLRALIEAPTLKRRLSGGALVAEERFKRSPHTGEPIFILRKVA